MENYKEFAVGCLGGDDPEKKIDEWERVGLEKAKWKPLSETFEARRKALVSVLKVNLRKLMAEEGRKVTDDTVDAEAHACSQYNDWLKEAIIEKETYETLEVKYKALEKRIEYLRTCISHGKKERSF